MQDAAPCEIELYLDLSKILLEVVREAVREQQLIMFLATQLSAPTSRSNFMKAPSADRARGVPVGKTQHNRNGVDCTWIRCGGGEGGELSSSSSSSSISSSSSRKKVNHLVQPQPQHSKQPPALRQTQVAITTTTIHVLFLKLALQLLT